METLFKYLIIISKEFQFKEMLAVNIEFNLWVNKELLN